MFDKKMSSANLAFTSGSVDTSRGGGMMLSHVKLQLFGVGVLRGFPSGLVSLGIKIVREILGIGVTNLPVGRQSSVCLRILLAGRNVNSLRGQTIGTEARKD
jgi:hypothetical protein